MRELYARQLRTDSIFLVIPVTVTVTILISVIAYIITGDVNSLQAFSILIANIAIPTISGHFAWTQAKKDQLELGGWIFIIVHLLIIALNYTQVTIIDSYLPYLYGFFIVVSSNIIKANASFRVWVLSTIFTIGALIYRDEANFLNIFSLMPAFLINFMLAVGSFITSVDWEMAVYSASESHVKAQRQRDQWYEAQEELKRINARQEFLYNQLATSMAVGQRVTAILDIEKLLGQVSELIQKQLGFAYVGIFLLDDSSSHLEIRTYSPIESTQPQSAIITLDDEHVIGLAAAHREHIAIPDVSQDNYHHHPYMLRNVRSEAGFPLVMGGRLLGAMNIQSYGIEAFDQSNLAMLQLLADQVAIAINNATLYRDQQIRYRLTQTMSQIQRAISSTIELDTVLDLILENLSTIVSYNRAAVFIYRNGPLDMVASRGFPDHINFIQITPTDDNDVFTKIYQSQKPLAIPDVKQYPTWKFLEDVPDTRAWLGVPLTIDNEVTGMLSLARDMAEPYTRD
ncbi:MAG: GAF domain-containing protein, partial [Anaerolineales bacterium]|nr:GAF domain-containing protein [Anaerolineales bacterium]